ncbi:ubiquinol-cytochrome c chaperone [Allostella humosa]|nr:ubiquinol-cytochrome c chaperone [Stella humosa]
MTVVEQARRPDFYIQAAVPDSIDGRFELIALHTFLVLHRLAPDAEASDLSQALFDRFFADMDRSLREMGVGDMGIGKRIQHMAQSFYGRMSVYREALAGDDAGLEAALRRNLYGTVPATEAPPVAAVAAYVRAVVADLASQPAQGLMAGKARFPEPPSIPASGQPA